MTKNNVSEKFKYGEFIDFWTCLLDLHPVHIMFNIYKEDAIQLECLKSSRGHIHLAMNQN